MCSWGLQGSGNPRSSRSDQADDADGVPVRAGGEVEHLEPGFSQLAPYLVLGEVVVERVPQRVAELHGEAAASQPAHGPRGGRGEISTLEQADRSPLFILHVGQ